MALRTVPALGFIMWLPAILFTRAVIFRNNLPTFVTLDRAAPVEFAVAAADDLNALLHHFEAAFVAQPAAALSLPQGHVLVSLQTFPPLEALESQAPVLDAVIRGILQVDELSASDAPKS